MTGYDNLLISILRQMLALKKWWSLATSATRLLRTSRIDPCHFLLITIRSIGFSVPWISLWGKNVPLVTRSCFWQKPPKYPFSNFCPIPRWPIVDSRSLSNWAIKFRIDPSHFILSRYGQSDSPHHGFVCEERTYRQWQDLGSDINFSRWPIVYSRSSPNWALKLSIGSAISPQYTQRSTPVRLL